MYLICHQLSESFMHKTNTYEYLLTIICKLNLNKKIIRKRKESSNLKGECLIIIFYKCVLGCCWFVCAIYSIGVNKITSNIIIRAIQYVWNIRICHLQHRWPVPHFVRCVHLCESFMCIIRNHKCISCRLSIYVRVRTYELYTTDLYIAQYYIFLHCAQINSLK